VPGSRTDIAVQPVGGTGRQYCHLASTDRPGWPLCLSWQDLVRFLSKICRKGRRSTPCFCSSVSLAGCFVGRQWCGSLCLGGNGTLPGFFFVSVFPSSRCPHENCGFQNNLEFSFLVVFLHGLNVFLTVHMDTRRSIFNGIIFPPGREPLGIAFCALSERLFRISQGETCHGSFQSG